MIQIKCSHILIFTIQYLLPLLIF
uniref:Uncharacterized protein n=1 Tax=Arundo donax TaxID=35708 RepID=A0A0A9C9A3_ARUDO